MIVFVVIVCLRRNRRLWVDESCQTCTFTVSFHKFRCVSTVASSVTVFMFSYGPCTHSNQIYVSEIYHCIGRAKKKCYECVWSHIVYICCQEIKVLFNH